MNTNPTELRPGQLKILKAVSTLLENPSGRITVARLAQEVGVTDAAIYRHYRSKEDIFQALMDYMETNFLGTLNTVQQESPNTRLRLERLFSRYMDFFGGHPGLVRLFLGHGGTEATGLTGRMQMLHSKIRSQVAQILRHGEAQAMLSPNVTPELGAELFYGLLAGAAMAHVYSLPQLDVIDRWNVYAKTVLR